jgi:hypothetical protein
MTPRLGKRFAGVVTSWVAVFAIVGRAAGQCAMCGSATPYAGASAGHTAATFAIAALVLLVPVLAMLATFVTYVWRHRH